MALGKWGGEPEGGKAEKFLKFSVLDSWNKSHFLRSPCRGEDWLGGAAARPLLPTSPPHQLRSLAPVAPGRQAPNEQPWGASFLGVKGVEKGAGGTHPLPFPRRDASPLALPTSRRGARGASPNFSARGRDKKSPNHKKKSPGFVRGKA